MEYRRETVGVPGWQIRKKQKTREKNVVIPGEQNERTRNGMRGIARVAS